MVHSCPNCGATTTVELTEDKKRLEYYEQAFAEALRGSGDDPEATDPVIWIDGLQAKITELEAKMPKS